MYWHDIYRIGHTIEHEIKWAGKHGSANEKRAKKVKPTKEQMEKVNQKNREKKMRRLIKANFSEGDLWCTLKYPAGTRKDIQSVKKDLDNFLRRLKRKYTKLEEDMKYIYRMEVGAMGGVHIHMLLNRIPGHDTDIMIKDAWKDGYVNYRSAYETGGFQQLAEYIVKRPEEGTEEYDQLTLFAQEEQKDLLKVSTSRNLVRPEPERHFYSRRTVRKLLENGPVPEEGYNIIKDSICIYENPFTGYTHMQYIEERRKNVSTKTYAKQGKLLC